MSTLTQATTAAWRAAGENGDATAATACLAENIEVISPLTAKFRFRGRDQVHDMLAAAFTVISDIKFHTETGDESTRALFYYGRSGSQQLEEAQLLRFDDAGLITELTLFGRPLPGLTSVMAGIGPKLLRRQGKPGLAVLIGVATRPVSLLTRLGERSLVPLADPAKARKRPS
jgi:hypothetical protein